MPLLRDIQVKMGVHEPPSAMERAQESVRRNPTLEKMKIKLGLQEKSELQQIQESMCPSLTYEQVRGAVRLGRAARGTRPEAAGGARVGRLAESRPLMCVRVRSPPVGRPAVRRARRTPQRMYGFGICICAGILLSLSSMFSFTKLVLGQPRDFAIKYTFGNVLAICSTGFLIGPGRQLRNMSASSRWIAALIYLFAMIMTLVSAFKIQIAGITVFFIIIQFCAMVWYCLSYIPFGRQMLAKCCKGMVEG